MCVIRRMLHTNCGRTHGHDWNVRACWSSVEEPSCRDAQPVRLPAAAAVPAVPGHVWRAAPPHGLHRQRRGACRCCLLMHMWGVESEQQHYALEGLQHRRFEELSAAAALAVPSSTHHDPLPTARINGGMHIILKRALTVDHTATVPCSQFLVLNRDDPRTPRTLPAFMRTMEAGGEFGGLAAAWVVFGSSGALFGTLLVKPFERLAACRTVTLAAVTHSCPHWHLPSCNQLPLATHSLRRGGAHLEMKQDTLQRLDEMTALTAGHKTRPEGGVLRNYVKCIPRDTVHSRHCKTIVNTKHADIAEGCAAPHAGLHDASMHKNWFADGVRRCSETA